MFDRHVSYLSQKAPVPPGADRAKLDDLMI